MEKVEIIEQRKVVTASLNRYNEALTRKPGLYGTDTGMHDLNMITMGHMPAKITTFAARSGVGKTAMITQMADAAARIQDERMSSILALSWEMHGSYLIDRYICHKVGITLSQLRYARALPDFIQNQIPKAYNEAAQLPIAYHHYSSTAHATTKIIDDWLKDIKGKEKLTGLKIQPVVFLDFIGRIQAGSRTQNKTYDIADFMQTMKQYSNDTGVSFTILAQINRTADGKEYPDASDLSDSQSIEQNSDTLIIGHRPEMYQKETMKDPLTGQEIPSRNQMLWRTVKCREGAPHDRIVNVNMEYFRIWSREHKFDYQYWKDYEKEEFWKAQYGV